MNDSSHRVELRIALLYALFGGLWIILSDRLLAMFITDVSLLTKLQTYKGWAFVIISALLIYALLRRELNLRKRTEDKFWESEERYRLLFESSIDAFLLTSPDGSILAANPAACHMFGWTEAELKQRGRSGVIDTSDPRLSVALEERDRNGNFRGELTFVRKDGSRFPGEISTAIFTDRQGEQRTSMIIRDITARVEAENALRLQSAALEAAANGIVITDRGGIIRWANPAFTKLSGFPLREALGKNPRDLIRSGKHSQAFYKNMLDAILAGQVWHGELINRRKDGTLYTEEMTLTPLKNEQGEVEYFIAIKQDISERVRVEEALHESEARLSGIIDSAMDAIISLDEDQRIILFNPAAEKLFRCPVEEALGQPLDRFIPERSREPHREHVRTFGQTNQTRRSMDTIGPLSCMRANGEEFPAEITISQTEMGGQKIYTAILRDITVRVRSEEALRESEERLQLFIEHAPAALAMFDREMRYLAVSQRWIADYSLGDQEILGRSHYEIFPEIPERWKEVHRRGLNGEVIKTDQDDFERIHGSVQWLRWEVRPWNTIDGAIGGIVIFTEDVTARIQAEGSLRESEEKYRLIFENVMNGFALHEIVLNEEGQPVNYIFREVNDAFEQLTGLKRENILGKKATEVIPGIENDPADWIGKYGEVTLTDKEARFEQHVEAIDKWYSVLAFRAREGQFATIFEDITDRKQFEAELRRRIDELSALYQTIIDIISVQELPDLLNTIVMRAVDLLDCTSGGLYLCNPELERARCVVSYNTPDDYTGTVLAYGEGAAGIVAATGKPLIIDDYQTWEERAEAFEVDHPFSAVISAPMLWHGRVIGVIHVLHDTQKHKFTEEDLQLLTSFANQAAIAVENSRLFEETQRRLERLSALRRIDQVITSSLDLRVTMNMLLGQTLQLMAVDAAAVLLYQPELQSLDYVAGQGFRTRALQSTTLRLGQGFAGQAALKQEVVQVFELNKLQTGFLRSPEFSAENFVAYIGVPLIAKGNIIGVLEIYHRKPLAPDEEWMAFLETLAGQAAIAIDNINLFNNLEMSNLELVQAYDATIEGWARALELRDMETEGHSRRVVDMTLDLARRLGVKEEQLMHIRQGALLHDIGKMGVPDSILQKSGPLTDDEWEIIHHHPVYANKWLSPIAYLKPALDIPYCHHEKWDGTGYPRGLQGEQIPMAARIFALVDVWDALTSNRPYRSAWSEKKTLAYIKKQSGKHFDPVVVEAFLKFISSS